MGEAACLGLTGEGRPRSPPAPATAARETKPRPDRREAPPPQRVVSAAAAAASPPAGGKRVDPNRPVREGVGGRGGEEGEAGEWAGVTRAPAGA
jgi:hypothetical protein